MRLFMANCTKQRQVIYYRLDFDRQGNFTQTDKRKSLKQVSVESGRQVTVGGDLHVSQAQSIMDQLQIHGAIGIDDFKRGQLKGVVRLVMSLDKQVPASVMMDVHKHNTEYLFAAGRSRRASAALVANKAVEDAVDATVNKFEVEVEQQEPAPGEPEPEGARLEEGYRAPNQDEVTAVAPPPVKPTGKGGGKPSKRG